MAIIGVSGHAGSGKDTVGLMIRALGENPNMIYEEYVKSLELKPSSDDYRFWQIKKFAGKLKELVAILLGCSVNDLEEEEFKNKTLGPEWWYFGFGEIGKIPTAVMVPYLETGEDVRDTEEHSKYLIKLTPRLLLQLLGTEGGRRVIHPNIWVNALFADYRKLNEILSVDSIVLQGLDGQKYPDWVITDVRFHNEANRVKEMGGILIRLERNIETSAGNLHESETALDNYQFQYVINNNDTTLEELFYKVKNLLYTIQIQSL
jgi:hypothetical protein